MQILPLLPLLALTGIGLLFFIDLVLYPADVLFAPHSDLLVSFLPQKDFVIEALWRTGELPLWNPYSFAGLPLTGDPEAGLFYPPHLLLLFLPRELLGPGMSWLVVAHVILAGVGGYLYARDRGLGATGAFVAGVGLMLSGKWMLHLLDAGHYSLIGFAWLPLVALALERSMGPGRCSWAVLSGGFLALLALGTHPQWTLLAVITVTVWSLGAAQGLAEWTRSNLLMLVVCGGLISVQILPFVEMLDFSTRGVLGTAADPAEKLRDHLVTLLGLVGPAPQDPLRFYETWELRCGWGYLWVYVVLLLPFLGDRSTRPRQAIFALLALATILAGFVLPRVPLLERLNHPSRMVLCLAFPLSFLAGRTVELLGRGGAEQRLRWEAPLLAGLLSWPVLLSASLLSWGPNLQPGVTGRFVGYWAWALAGLVVIMITSRRAEGPMRSSWVAALLVVDLWMVSWPSVQTIIPEARYPVSSSVRLLEEAGRDHGRVLASGPLCTYPSPLGFGLGVMRRIERIGGYGPLDIHRYRWLLHILAAEDGPTLGSQILTGIPIRHPDLLETLAVKYALVPEDPGMRDCEGGPDPLVAMGTWRKLHVDPRPRAYSWVMGRHLDFPPYAVYENTRYCGRAFWRPRAEKLAPREERAAQVLRTEFREVVLLDEGVPEGVPEVTKQGRGKASIEMFEPNRVEVGVEADSPGFLVLADPWYPGWTATVDGSPAPVLRANVAMRAVAVPAGSHRVVFRFEPHSYRLGLLLSSLSAALVLMSFLASFRRAVR